MNATHAIPGGTDLGSVATNTGANGARSRRSRSRSGSGRGGGQSGQGRSVLHIEPATAATAISYASGSARVVREVLRRGGVEAVVPLMLMGVHQQQCYRRHPLPRPQQLVLARHHGHELRLNEL